jgi:pimeloyl-ACP methyl ester carboxylesterase
MPAERFDFRNAEGQTLAALLDRPDGEMRAVALFAHCFTCGKHNRAARHITDGLKQRGIAALRFDFTGLGASEGEFANTTFSSNVDDLVAAADHLRRALAAPTILIGHSLGGAAVLAAAHRIPEARAVVTIAAPFDPAHVTGLFRDQVAEIGEKGEVEVTLAGRSFRIRRGLLNDIAEQNLSTHIGNLRKALLVFHFTDRRHGRHRQRESYFYDGETSQELHFACGGRSLAQPFERRSLCCACRRGLGRALPRYGGGCRGDSGNS